MHTEYIQCVLSKKLKNSILETVTFLIWDHGWIITGMSSHSQNIFTDDGYDFDFWSI